MKAPLNSTPLFRHPDKSAEGLVVEPGPDWLEPPAFAEAF